MASATSLPSQSPHDPCCILPAPTPVGPTTFSIVPYNRRSHKSHHPVSLPVVGASSQACQPPASSSSPTPYRAFTQHRVLHSTCGARWVSQTPS